MPESTTRFTLVQNSVTMTVTGVFLQGYQAYRIVFSSSRPPLVIVRTTNFEGEKFWTSVPEGRQREAEGVGALVEAHLKITS